jgi:LysM repeat protein
MPSPGGARSSVPEMPSIDQAKPEQVARAAKTDPIIVLVDPTAQPTKEGKLPLAVYRARAAKQPVFAQDRSYRLKKGETLNTVARKFRVTTKALLVANGAASPSALRAGSVVKVPGTFDVMVDNKRLAFDVTPRVENGLPIAPFRQIFEHSGGVVVWYPETREVRAAKDDREVKLKIGNREALVNQVIVVMDREPYIDSGRTMVPISFMEKAREAVVRRHTETGRARRASLAGPCRSPASSSGR